MLTKKDEHCETELRQIYELLFRLGANAGCSAFFQTAYTVYLAMEDPERMSFVTKWLYPATAKAYGTNWRAVERNIRSIIRTVWLSEPERLRKIAGYRLYSRPAPAAFIALLSAYLAAQGQEASAT